MEFFAIFGIAILVFMAWQLKRAKQYNQFLSWLSNEIKPKLEQHIKDELIETRSELTPNNQAHQQATLYFYTCARVRIFQTAVEREIIPNDWLKQKSNKRMAQHLLHKEQTYRI